MRRSLSTRLAGMVEEVFVERDARVRVPPRRVQHDLHGQHLVAELFVLWRLSVRHTDVSTCSHLTEGNRPRVIECTKCPVRQRVRDESKPFPFELRSNGGFSLSTAPGV